MTKQDKLDMFAATVYPFLIQTSKPKETAEQTADYAYATALILYEARQRYIVLKPGEKIIRSK